MLGSEPPGCTAVWKTLFNFYLRLGFNMIDVDKFDLQFATSGDGLWSSAKKLVRIKSIKVRNCLDEDGLGELRVYFDTNTWDIMEDGLIYTDCNFLKELKALLVIQGLIYISEVGYSEQGMQGDDYVSLDIGSEFIGQWKKAFGPEGIY